VPLADYFCNTFKDLNLVDVEPHKVISPRWNSRRGRDEIAKRLDRSLVAESF